jgi:hypothetical protein
MALLDRTVALEDLLKGLGGEPASGGTRTDAPSGVVRSQTATPVARTAQRPTDSPRRGAGPVQSLPSSATLGAPSNESQLQEMKRAMEATAQDTNRSRMTPEALKEERLGMLRKKDPALGAAIDELDLELLD